VEQNFKSSAYYAWNLKLPNFEEYSIKGSLTLFILNNYCNIKHRRNADNRRGSSISNQESTPSMENQTIIPFDPFFLRKGIDS